MNPNVPVKKKNNFVVISIVVGVVVLALLAVLMVVLMLSGEAPIYGEWDCEPSARLMLNKNKTFEMYLPGDRNQLDVVGTFTVEDKGQTNGYAKYMLEMTTNDRTVNGETLTNEYTMKYEVTFDPANWDEFMMINTRTYSMYACGRLD